MSEHSAENGLPEGAVTEEEWAVHYGDPAVSTNIRSMGTGFWAKRHAEQEVERVLRNATLPNFGQPMTASVVRRTVTRYYSATDWTRPLPPGGSDA
jgi:hypothetical protein